MTDLIPTELCAWCSKIIKKGDVMAPLTHGICWKCSEIYFPLEIAGIRAKCDHDFEQIDIDHETSGYPSGYNYKTESIIETTYRTHAKTERCEHCGFTVERDWEDCDCEDDGPDDDDPRGWEPVDDRDQT